MLGQLRAWYTPAEIESLAARSAVLEGRFNLDQMTRLAGYLGARSSQISAEYRFSGGGSGWVKLELHFTANVELSCQRCLAPLQIKFDDQVSFGIVADDSLVAVVPKYCEAVVLNDERLDLQALLEDEVIIGLPVAPKHGDEHSCQIRE